MSDYEFDDIPDTLEQRQLIADHNADIRKKYLNLVPLEEPVEVYAAVIRYTNWKGKLAYRRILPISFWYGSTEYHPEKQWFVKAYDMDKETERDFALVDIG